MNEFKLKNKNFKKQRGFTVLESIVAIFILSLAVSGAFSAVQQSLSQSIIAKDEVKSFYMAQEAVEVIRNKRDSNQLEKIAGLGTNWLSGITSACPAGSTCTVDATNFQIANCGAGGWGSCSQNLKQNPSTFLYGYTSGNDTGFKREIQIVSINAHEIAVTVRVSWTKGLISREFKAKALLFDWI